MVTAISKLSDAPHHFLDALRKVLGPADSTGNGVEIFLSPSKAKKWLKSVHIGMRNHDDAAKLMDLLQGKSIDLELPAADGQGTVLVATGALFLTTLLQHIDHGKKSSEAKQPVDRPLPVPPRPRM